MISQVGLDIYTVKGRRLRHLAVEENHPITANDNRGLEGGSVRIRLIISSFPRANQIDTQDPQCSRAPPPSAPHRAPRWFLLSFLLFLLSLFLSLESWSIVANRSRFFCEQMRP